MVWGNLATGYWLGGAAVAGLHWVELGRTSLSSAGDEINVTGGYPTLPSATLTENFGDSTSHSSDGTTVNGWYSADADKTFYDGSNNYGRFDYSGATNAGLSFDLEQSGNGGLGTSINSTTWTLRFKFHIITNASNSGDGSQAYLGIGDHTGSASSIESSQDFIGLSLLQNHNTHGDRVINASCNDSNPINFGNTSGRYATLSLANGTSYYVQIVRNGDDCTVQIFSDSGYSSNLFSNTQTVSGITGLRYLIFEPANFGALTTAYIDDIQFYNGHAHVESDLAAKPYMMFLTQVLDDGTDNPTLALRLNADSGNNYASRYSADGGSDGTSTSANNIYGTDGIGAGSEAFMVGHITNISNKEKLTTINSTADRSGTGGGNALNRWEIVGKWVNTSDNITQLNIVNTNTGNFNTNSECIVLGYDPDDTEGTSVWEELDSDSGTSPLCSFTAKKYLWVQAHVKGSASGKFQFGNGSLDTGTNYAVRYQSGGAADDTNTSITGSEPLTITTPIYFNMFIINKSDKEKLAIIEGARQNTAGAGTAPNRWEEVLKWVNTSNQINRIGYAPHGSGATLDSSCQIKVWGFD